MLLLRNKTLSFPEPSARGDVSSTRMGSRRRRRAEASEEAEAEEGSEASPSSSSPTTREKPKPLPLPPLPLTQRLLLTAATTLRFTAGTNDRVLVMRTLSHELDDPSLPKHGDYLCRQFRDSRRSGGGSGATPLRSLSRAVGISEKAYWKLYARRLEALVPGNYRFMDARVRYFDGVVAGAASGGVRQVVMLASGFDSRGTRFLADPRSGSTPPEGSGVPGAPPSAPAGDEEDKGKRKAKAPNLRIYEVDLPPIVEKKRELLDELLPDAELWPRPVFVAADLSDAASAARALSAAPGFDRNAKTLFTAEGLLPYLPRSKTIEMVRELWKVSGKGSEFAFDFLDAGACGVDGGGGGSGKRVSKNKNPFASVAFPGRATYAALAHAVKSSGEPFMDAMPSDEASQRLIAREAGADVAAVLSADGVAERFYPSWDSSRSVPAVSPVNAFAVWRKA